MNLITIIAITIGILLIAGIVITGFITADIEEPTPCVYRNSCSLDKNCGLESCGAIQGNSCGCN